MADNITALRADLADLVSNPTLVQRRVFQFWDAVSNGEVNIVDPTGPFQLLTETATVLTSVAVDENRALNRKQYPYSAQVQSEIYLHMSDRDYIDRFAKPAKIVIGMALDYEELLQRMVLDVTTGIRKLVIPRNSYFTVADTVFSLQYPIEIRQMSHGGIQVVYDTDVDSPLQTLETNLLTWDFRKTPDGVKFLVFTFDAYQFNIVSEVQPLTSATSWVMELPITDQFYFARVHSQNPDGSWTEIRTTHSEEVYDIATPTAVLRVDNSTLAPLLTIRIPQIYTTAGSLGSMIRVDLYQTKGAITMDMGSYPSDSIVATWLALDELRDESIFTAEIRNFKTKVIFSSSVTTGGANQLDFLALRERVLRNSAGQQDQPITPNQIEDKLVRDGYEIVKNIDNITNRVFLATRHLPAPTNPDLITSASAGIFSLTVNIRDAVLLDTVVDNGSSITITPDTIYETVRGVLRTVSSEKVNYILSMPAARRALEVTNNNYFYSPFHYVLDMSDDLENEFEARAYQLDRPVAISKSFETENDTTGMQVSAFGYEVLKVGNNYKLRLSVRSSDEFKALDDADIYVQLAYIPYGEKDRAYLLGEMVGLDSVTEERVYEFDLSTNLNVTSKNNLQLTKFQMYNSDPRITDAPLITTFDILFSTSIIMGNLWQPNQIDDILGRFQLPTRIAGITHERLTVEFGQSLKTLWTRARSVVGAADFQTYEIDLPAVYENDVFDVDQATGSAAYIENGELKYRYLHRAGDPIVDDNGQVVYRYRKGDIVRDPSGDPVRISPRNVIREIDLMLVEGAYWFGTDSSAVEYRREMINIFTSWLVNDLGSIQKKLLEQTRIYFYPKATLGELRVMVEDGRTINIQAGLSFKVKLYVRSTVYDNESLKKQLSRSTISTISNALKGTELSISDLYEQLRTAYGGDVVDVEVENFVNGRYSVLTVLDESGRCSIRKRLVALPDNRLVVQEDCAIDFVRHQLTN